jgi:hypothetical protein
MFTIAERFLTQPAESAPSIVFEVHALYVDWADGLASMPIVRLLEERGYSTCCVRDYQSNVVMRGEPIELIPRERAVLAGPPHGFNMLAVKDAALVSGDEFRVRVDVSPKLLRHRDPALHQPIHDES